MRLIRSVLIGLVLCVAWSTEAAKLSDKARSLISLRHTNLAIGAKEISLQTAIRSISDITGLKIRTLKGIESKLEEVIQIPFRLIACEGLFNFIIRELNQDELSPIEWQLTKSGSIEVGLKDDLSKKKYLVVYPAADLLWISIYFNNAPNLDISSALNQGGGGGTVISDPEESPLRERRQAFDQLVEAITFIVEPGAWERNGGAWAKIHSNPFHGTVLITAPEFIHRKLTASLY